MCVAHESEAAPREERKLNTNLEAVVTLGSYARLPAAALLDGGVAGADAVILGGVLDVWSVPVADDATAWHEDVASMSIAKTWMAPHRDSLNVRLLAGTWDSPSRSSWPVPQPGDNWLLFLSRDQVDELVAIPGAVVRPDTSLLLREDGHLTLSTTRLLALVDSCASRWSLQQIAGRSETVMEGTVEEAPLTGPSVDLRLIDLVMLRGEVAQDTLHLVASCDGWVAPRLPSIPSDLRVVLFLAPCGRSLELIGGWHGAWVVKPDGGVRASQSFRHGGFGTVHPGAAVRASTAVALEKTRAELVSALSGD
jgi:hypothetical protein